MKMPRRNDVDGAPGAVQAMASDLDDPRVGSAVERLKQQAALFAVGFVRPGMTRITSPPNARS